MIASDVYMREDKNEAAHIAAQAAVRGAAMGDITASGAFMVALCARGLCFSERRGDVVAVVLLSCCLRLCSHHRTLHCLSDSVLLRPCPVSYVLWCFLPPQPPLLYCRKGPLSCPCCCKR